MMDYLDMNEKKMSKKKLKMHEKREDTALYARRKKSSKKESPLTEKM